MYCTHCGAKIADNSRFCPNCGKSVDTIASEPQKPAHEITESARHTTSTFKAPSFKRGEKKQSNSKSSSGERISRAVINKVLSELQDLDLYATSAQGEMRFPASKAQSMFMSFIKKGILILCLLMLLPVGKVWADSSISNSFEEYALKMNFTVSGGNINPKEKVDDDSYAKRRHFSGTIKPGQTISVSAAVTRGADDTGMEKWNYVHIWITGKNPDKNVEIETSGGADLPSASAQYVVTEDDKEVDVTIDTSTSTWHPMGGFTAGTMIFVHYKVEHNDSVGSTNGSSGTSNGDKTDNNSDDIKVDVTIDSHASKDDDGSDGGSGWVIPISVLVGVGGYAATKFGGRKKKEDESSDDNKKDDEDQYTYEMRIRQDFGEMLYPGDPEQPVYARIVKIDRQGHEITDPTLTQRISIFGDDYVEVSDHQMAGEYMGAYVKAPASDLPPSEAIVHFKMTAAGGSFTNRMHFKVAQQMIVLAEDELTLPAALEKPIYLPFEVLGMGDDFIAEATISGKSYTVEVLRRPEDEGVCYVVITDQDKTIGTPGDVTRSILTVSATSREGRAITTDLTVSRFTMGLACKGLERVKCYLEEYDASRHVFSDLQRQVEVDMATNIVDDPCIVTKTMTPAETRFSLSIYEYNEEDGSIVCVPPTITKYNVIIDEEPPAAGAAVPALSCAGMMFGGVLPAGVGGALNSVADDIDAQNSAYKKHAETVRALGFHIDAVKGFVEKDRDAKELICYMVCRGGKLDSPNRLTARIIIEAEYNGRKYYLEHRTLLVSQPERHIELANFDELCKRDDQISEALECMRSNIFIHHYADLHLLHLLIETMLDKYKIEYGYDWQMVRGVFRVYNGYLNNQRIIDNLSVNDDAMCLAYAVDRLILHGKMAEAHLGFFPRLLLGVATFGGSEFAFNTLEVVGNMKKYVDEGGDSILVGWINGSKVAFREYLWGLAMKYGLAKIKDLLKGKADKLRNIFKKGNKTVGTTTKQTGKQVKNAAENTVEDAAKKANKEMAEDAARKASQEISEGAADATKHAKQVKAAQEKAAARTSQAKKEARKLADETRQKMDPETQKLCDAEESGLLAGQEKIERYRRACELPDTPKYRQARLDAMMEVQADKNALNLLNDVDNQTLIPLRKNFNADIRKVHYSAEFDMKAILAEQLEHDPRFKGRKFQICDIETFNATKSSRDALDAGTKITFDYDGSFYVVDKNGAHIYLDQKQVQEAFEECLYRKAKGGEKASAEVAADFFEITDHSIVQSDSHIESYGIRNINPLLKDPLKALPDPDRAAKAFTDKCMHWYKDGLELISKGGKDNIERGVAHIRESFRTCKKQFDNFAVIRDAAREGVNGGSQISDEMYRLVNYLGETDVFKGSLKVGECLKGLEQMGTSPQRIFQELGEVIRRIG